YHTAHLLLPRSWSITVALGGALGTQIWSTASRGLWTDTWGLLLSGIIIYLLLAHETEKRRLNPILLATLLAWVYFVRPTNAVQVLVVTVYILFYQRRLFVKLALIGAFWLALFIIYARHNFGQWLPSYYMATRMKFDTFVTALAGHLVSPGRGL